jgi:hypothetical protein
MKEFFDDDLRSPSVLNFIYAVILALALPPQEAAYYRRPAKVRNQGQVDDVVKTVPVIHIGIASKIVTERLALKIHRDWLSPTRTNATSKVRGNPHEELNDPLLMVGKPIAVELCSDCWVFGCRT